MLPELPKRIECFDISHIQGAETVASLVVWEDGKMNKSAYRKFKVMTVLGVDDFASMREVVHRRYKRLKDEDQPMPSLVLIDGGLGQLHAAADALEAPRLHLAARLASIAKKEEVIYVYGNEDDPVPSSTAARPCCISCSSSATRVTGFAIGYHRQRPRSCATATPSCSPSPASARSPASAAHPLRQPAATCNRPQPNPSPPLVPRKTAETIWRHFHQEQPSLAKPV